MQTSGEANPISLGASANNSAAVPGSSGRLRAIGRNAILDSIAGLIASIILIANIVSFGALMFPSQLNVGLPVAIWAMLIGSAVGGTWIALATSLPPLATAIDSPPGTVLVLFSA